MPVYVCSHVRVSIVGRCCGLGFRSGLHSPPQTLRGLQSALRPRSMSYNSQQTHGPLGPRPRPKFSMFPPGRWGLLAPFGSSGSAWETRGASEAQMPTSLGCHSAMTGRGPGWGLSVSLRSFHLLILQPLLVSNHTIWDGLSPPCPSSLWWHLSP